MNELKALLDRFNALGDLNNLKREGRDFSFQDVHQYVLKTYQSLSYIVSNPSFWDSLPENIRNTATSIFSQFIDQAEQIKSFNPAQGANQSTRDSIANNIKSFYSQMYAPILMPLDIHQLQNSLESGNIQQLARNAQDVFSEIQKQKNQSDDLIKAIQTTAAVGGVNKFTGIFATEASKHRNIAILFLVATIAAGTFGILFLYETFTHLTDALKSVSDSGESVSVTLQLFFAKILILSFVSVLFYQIVKNYNANMHLYVLNKHRENSLKTFQAFVESTSDPKTKDIILVQSTGTIFSAGETGYISSKDGGGPSFDTLKILEQAQR